MPSKIQLDENLWFLYICLTKSDLKTIDFTAVGEVTNLKPPAARMRYTRLRRQIESGTLAGKDGVPFAGKRKRSDGPGTADVSAAVPMASASMDVAKMQRQSEGGDFQMSQPARARPENHFNPLQTRKAEKQVDQKEFVKVEDKSHRERYEDSESDSDAEVPLAKLRKVGIDRRGESMMIAPFFPSPLGVRGGWGTQ